jgi:tRNA (cmo5U34)-methyltransferase
VSKFDLRAVELPGAISRIGCDIPAVWTFNDRGVAAGFDRHVREQLPWYDLATGAVAHIARHYLSDGGLVYDLGAATGNIGRALAEPLEVRGARLVSIEASAEMAALYDGPQPENIQLARIEDFDFEPFDVAIAFLTLMFVPPARRERLLVALEERLLPSGALIIFDKLAASAGYPATILWRLTLAGKVATGVDPAEIVAKELSLSGVQRPLDPRLFDCLPRPPLEFFRFGEFAGWLYEK